MFNESNFIPLENKGDVTTYFVLDRTEMCALLSVWENTHVTFLSMFETRYDVTSILKVSWSLISLRGHNWMLLAHRP